MKVVIDALSARNGGGVTYLKQILPMLAQEGGGFEYSVLLSSQYQNALIAELPSNVALIDTKLSPSLAQRWWYTQYQLPYLLRELGASIFFAVAEGSYLRIPIPFVMMVRNLNIYATPDYAGKQRIRWLYYRLQRQLPVFLSMCKAARIVFVSRVIQDYVTTQMRISKRKNRVIHHGVSAIFREQAPLPPMNGDFTSYLLTVSSINPHKNYETLIEAYARLPAEAPGLFIAGEVSDQNTYHQLQAKIEKYCLQEKIKFLGKIAYDKLPSLYQGAAAFIFPSRLESFGHPLIEAMASGIPVIASDLPICREICEDAALYFSPTNADKLAEQIKKCIDDANHRKQLIDLGKKQSQRYSWQESARQLINVFHELT